MAHSAGPPLLEVNRDGVAEPRRAVAQLVERYTGDRRVATCRWRLTTG